jgi:hypothetical protein
MSAHERERRRLTGLRPSPTSVCKGLPGRSAAREGADRRGAARHQACPGGRARALPRGPAARAGGRRRPHHTRGDAGPCADDGATPKFEPAPALVAPAATALVAALSAPVDSTAARPNERSVVTATGPGSNAAPDLSATATLTVRVVDEAGVGVLGAFVTAQPTVSGHDAVNQVSDDQLMGSTNGDGRAVLKVRAGRRLELRGWRTAETSVGTMVVEALAAGARASCCATGPGGARGSRSSATQARPAPRTRLTRSRSYARRGSKAPWQA